MHNMDCYSLKRDITSEIPFRIVTSQRQVFPIKVHVTSTLTLVPFLKMFLYIDLLHKVTLSLSHGLLVRLYVYKYSHGQLGVAKLFILFCRAFLAPMQLAMFVLRVEQVGLSRAYLGSGLSRGVSEITRTFVTVFSDIWWPEIEHRTFLTLQMYTVFI